MKSIIRIKIFLTFTSFTYYDIYYNIITLKTKHKITVKPYHSIYITSNLFGEPQEVLQSVPNLIIVLLDRVGNITTAYNY